MEENCLSQHIAFLVTGQYLFSAAQISGLYKYNKGNKKSNLSGSVVDIQA